MKSNSKTRSKHFVGGSCGTFFKKMNFTKIEGEIRNTYVYMADEFCYVKNKQYNDKIYLKCKSYQICDFTTKSMSQVKFYNLRELTHVVVEENTLGFSLP